MRLFLLIFLVVFFQGRAQNIAPTVSATSDPYYCPLTSQPVVSFFDISDPDDTSTDAFYIQISEGYDSGFDLLSLEGSHPNVIANWNAAEAKLTLTSSSSAPLYYSDLIAAVYDVNFFCSDPNISQNRVFSLTVGEANYLALTDHYYEFVPDVAILWTDAKVAAENMTYYGLQGYLATLTGPDEAFLVGELSPGVGWIGGSDQAAEGVWIWETGPEAGLNFWNGTANGSTPNYAFWNTNEPNNLGDEDYAHITDDSIGINGSWNDLPNQTAGLGAFEAKGFIVEYGGMPGDPALTISAITEFLVPQITSVQNDSTCSDEQVELSAETTGGDIYWFDAQSGGNLIHTGTAYNPVLTTTTSFWVSTGTNNCSSGLRTEVIATVQDTPTANLPSNIDICDDNNDGISDVDFDALVTSQVLGSQSATDFEVLYFSSQANADSGENPISMPFTNTANPQEIFVRIQNALNADCFDTNSFFVEVFDTPVANTVADLRFCDDGADGSLTNGQMVVDLSLATPVVLGTQNAADYTVTYHWSQADADDGTNDLSLNYYNTTAFSETIFVRIENVLNEDCFDTNSFTLEVNPIPSSFNSALFQCDEDGFVDGFTLFNCHQADQSLTGNVTGLSTSFYTTLADAQSGTNPIDGYNFANTSNPQVLYVQVKDDNTACFSISELSLEVSTTDVSDAMLVRCDDDGTEDGLASFDLSLADSLVLVSAPAGVTITYYASNQDALLEQNPLVSPFTNTTAYSQNIYARAEDDNACYGISQLLLKVNPLPLLDQDQSVIYCLNNYPSTLTLNAGVIGGSSGLNYQWSNGETSQSIQVNQAGVYTVSVENSNGCTQSRQITVVDSEVATIDNITVSDASQVNSIAVSVSGDGDYEFALDNPLGPYQDLNSFDNVLPGIHTVYVRDKNGCGVTQEMVSVIGFMKFFTPNGDGINDLWQIIGISSQFQPDSKVFIYDRYGKLLIQISPQQGGWNGNYNGYKMPAADYWFHATLQDGRSFKGHFTLKR